MLGTVAAGQDAADGGLLYERHCATCHGLSGEGQGPMAGVLVIQPTDLTTLAARAGGAFPVLRVIRRIDGRDPLVAHGSPMPVYGDFFEGDDTTLETVSGQRVTTSRAIADLVSFLQTMQSVQE
ncbi:c-type cytochrome [Aquicoccus porphyridii]|uniref:c-type cytochrome n=1 Tax=Aquicoccus porphyridii TaxID=1852029 RepID=UPI00273F6083|nr:cytochrome c [Aquicoccus porphyridii]